MTRYTITSLATAFLLSLVPAANAYGLEPVFTVTDAAVTAPRTADAGQICIPRITPALAEALALPKAPDGANVAKTACLAE